MITKTCPTPTLETLAIETPVVPVVTPETTPAPDNPVPIIASIETASDTLKKKEDDRLQKQRERGKHYRERNFAKLVAASPPSPTPDPEPKPETIPPTPYVYKRRG